MIQSLGLDHVTQPSKFYTRETDRERWQLGRVCKTCCLSHYRMCVLGRWDVVNSIYFLIKHGNCCYCDLFCLLICRIVVNAGDWEARLYSEVLQNIKLAIVKYNYVSAELNISYCSSLHLRGRGLSHDLFSFS